MNARLIFQFGAATVALALFGITTLPSIAANSPGPALGFSGRVMDIPSSYGVPAPDGLPNRGMLVEGVYPQTAAAQLGLERGDIVVSIDSMRFTSMDGYRHALSCASDRPSFVIRDVRTGRLLRHSTWFPHLRPDDAYCTPNPPDTYWMSIDLIGDIR